MNGRATNHKRSGFTLVELLVVIGIIALLVSILLPALGRARQQAMIIKCAANERTIMQAFQIYAAQFKGSLPAFCYDGWRSWDQELSDYAFKAQNRDSLSSRTSEGNTNERSYAIWACPADDLPRRPAWNYTKWPIRSYAVNQSKWGWGQADSYNGPGHGWLMPWSGGVVNGSYSPSNVQNVKLSQVPARIWIFGENWGTTSIFTGVTGGSFTGPNLDPNANGSVVGTVENSTLEGSTARFHSYGWGFQRYKAGNNGGNYAYADGHVEFLKFDDIYKVRCDTDPTSNGSILEDHWKWKPGVH